MLCVCMHMCVCVCAQWFDNMERNPIKSAPRPTVVTPLKLGDISFPDSDSDLLSTDVGT